MVREMICSVLLTFGVSVFGFAAADDAFQFPATGVKCAKQAMFLGIDDVSIPLRNNIVLEMSKPKIRPKGVLLPTRDDPTAPDSIAAHFYGTVLHEPGITPGSRLRMWYYACHKGKNPDWPEALDTQAGNWPHELQPGPLCYAESKDGIQWQKVKLGQLLFKGDRDNNAFDLPSALTAEALVIKDEDDPDPQRRYKMTYWTQYDPLTNSSHPTMQLATSRHGIKWKTAKKLPLPNTFLEEGSFYKYNGFYFANAQTFRRGPNNRSLGRVATAFISPDFDHWFTETSQAFLLPKDSNGKRPQVHLGIGAKSFGNVLVGIYGRWHDNAAFEDNTCDLGLVVSNDGLKFREPDPEFILIDHKESPASVFTGKKLNTILAQGNGILNVGDQTFIYHGRWANAIYDDPTRGATEDYSAEVALATMPRDRWGALTLSNGASSGSMWTTPVILPKNPTKMSFNGVRAGGVTIEVADARFGMIHGIAGKVEGEQGLDCPVNWQGESLSSLAGKKVRFRITMQKGEKINPRLYALYLNTTDQHLNQP